MCDHKDCKFVNDNGYCLNDIGTSMSDMMARHLLQNLRKVVNNEYKEAITVAIDIINNRH